MELGKRVWFGELTRADLKKAKDELVRAGVEYYKNNDEEYTDCDKDNKNWVLSCTSSHIREYISKVKA